ncbi:E3 ubiquitin-protein ligase RNF4 [Dendrobates tinctorius]|uniref:E3 ubiquitin-protein ligase RNF4 n=1 Tax=Dendrobates tinctorius TaxID=92724 RepID=UPI003CCA159C
MRVLMIILGQRKRKAPAVGKSRLSQRRRRGASTTSSMAAETDPIEVEEGGEDVVDLTCESSFEPVVVDLTHNVDQTLNDSVVVIEVHRRRNAGRTTTQTTSCILSSDDEDTRDNDILASRSSNLPPTMHTSSRLSGSVTCPICMDGYSEIVQNGRLIVSTKCGHIFCSQCLRDSLKNIAKCPTCRQKLTPKQYHPIYI